MFTAIPSKGNNGTQGHTNVFGIETVFSKNNNPPGRHATPANPAAIE